MFAALLALIVLACGPGQAFAANANALVSIHGMVLAVMPNGNAIVRNDAVPGRIDAQSIEYKLVGAPRLKAGEDIYGIADMSSTPWSLLHVRVADDTATGTASAPLSHRDVAGSALSVIWEVLGLGVFGYLFYWTARKIFIENV